nr:tetratricopeptide repeat protein [Psychrobacter pasteurii]
MPDAQYNLAISYQEGEGVPKDIKQALKWYTQAAEQDYGKASYNLGTLYYNGDGVKQNYTKAKEWFQRSCEDEELEGCSIYLDLEGAGY